MRNTKENIMLHILGKIDLCCLFWIIINPNTFVVFHVNDL